MSGITTVNVAPDSELGRALRDNEWAQVTLIIEGRRFRVESIDGEETAPEAAESDDIWTGFDERRFVEGIDAAAGSWADIDTERLKADIRQWRELGSRPMERP